MVRKTGSPVFLVVMAIVLLTLAFSPAIAQGQDQQQGQEQEQEQQGQQQRQQEQEQAMLGDAEIAVMAQICEQAKLAKEVYDAYFKRWELRVFSHISKDESKRLASALKLLAKYGLPDPTLASVGEFTDPSLRNLFLQLTNFEIVSSATEAFWYSAFLEETKIQRLSDSLEGIPEGAEPNPSLNVYQHVLRELRCSRNHLRTFVLRIEAEGEVYEAQVLSQQEVDVIMDFGMERGPFESTRSRNVRGGDDSKPRVRSQQ